MTGGGPGTASDVVSTFVYKQAFQNQEFGYAAAAALFTSLIIAAIAMIFMTVFRPRGIGRAG
jgi:ABC-type sugar transport system permease subunit